MLLILPMWGQKHGAWDQVSGLAFRIGQLSLAGIDRNQPLRRTFEPPQPIC